MFYLPFTFFYTFDGFVVTIPRSAVNLTDRYPLGTAVITMFRRKADTLPADPVFEPDLEKLGFYINSEDKVRSIRNPERRYQYMVNRNERWNQVHRGMLNYLSSIHDQGVRGWEMGSVKARPRENV